MTATDVARNAGDTHDDPDNPARIEDAETIPTVEGETVVDAEATAASGEDAASVPDDARPRRASRVIRAVGYGALLALPFVLALVAGYVKYLGWTQSEIEGARTDSVRAASDSAIAMLSYRPDTVQNDLDGAASRMTGPFRDSYSSLVDDVVAPAAIQKLITAQATVPASASVSATPHHAVAIIFVNQTVTVGSEPPSNSNSSVRVTLDKVGDRWLVSGFDPV